MAIEPLIRSVTLADFTAIRRLLGALHEEHRRWRPESFRPTVLGFTEAYFDGWIAQPDTVTLVATLEVAVVAYARAQDMPLVDSSFRFPRRNVVIHQIAVDVAHPIGECVVRTNPGVLLVLDFGVHRGHHVLFVTEWRS